MPRLKQVSFFRNHLSCSGEKVVKYGTVHLVHHDRIRVSAQKYVKRRCYQKVFHSSSDLQGLG